MKAQLNVISSPIETQPLNRLDEARYEQLALRRLKWMRWRERWRVAWRVLRSVGLALRRSEEVRQVGPGQRPLSRYEWEKPDRGRWIY